MSDEYYPWGGDYTIGNNESCVAVVLLNIDYTPPSDVAIYGHLKTENIGVEKIVANVISNPHIRYLVVCGEEIRGHRSGGSLVMLHKNDIDEQHRIINAPGAIPYIENLDENAIQRFQEQIEIINLIGVTDENKIDEEIKKCLDSRPPVFGEPYIAIKIVNVSSKKTGDKKALHSRIMIDYLGRVKRRE
ncbi:MAG TPA: tetrahydromethanopterin S-methyltransferase subunit A [Thermoplasmatales archaeon]|nr:tetrahydromethanopterin S-methyltransferase subunit A [Thermoplasmatales archaeon]